MKKAGNDHLLTLVQYPEAGHLIEPPYTPHFRATRFNKNGEVKPRWFLSGPLTTGVICVPAVVVWGGTTKPHSDAQEDSWRKTLTFLQQHLYSNPTPRAKM